MYINGGTPTFLPCVGGGVWAALGGNLGVIFVWRIIMEIVILIDGDIAWIAGVDV